MKCLVVDVRVVEHRFRRNAANIQTRSTEGPALLYACSLRESEPQIKKTAENIKSQTHLKTKLSSLNCSHISTRSCNKKSSYLKIMLTLALTSTDNDSIVLAAR